ncbi:MAG TPA: alpha-amylase family glycosyl hydrolase [Bryobacteraceae bacterium]|nr:alpha-amylase family glycosyl hydrolase [Bryobacteraceae bacterium]
MAHIAVAFTFHSGIKRHLFRNVRLSGSWNAAGHISNLWTEAPMAASRDETGCEAFSASVSFDASQIGTVFQWGVVADIEGASNAWVVVTETADAGSNERFRSFILSAGEIQQDYWFATGRRFGAQKYFGPGSLSPAIRFAVWAPHARNVEVVFAPFDLTSDIPTGYIADDGRSVDPTAAVVPLVSKGGGVWESDIARTPALANFDDYMNRLYMYRITNEQGALTYKVDIFSRNQVGRGGVNPGGADYAGSYLDLDGIVSCSVVSDPDRLAEDFNDTGMDKRTLIPEEEFWASEFTPGRMLPRNIEDLIIYELHVGSLGFPSASAGTFADAMAFVEKLTDLGVNAVELLPVLEFDGDLQWGYGTSLFFCLQTSAGGANQLKHFVRACHQRGIAVILDVVYNHFATADNERSEWGYDSDPNVAPQNNVWYWYQGQPTDYPGNLNGGYLNNLSSGYTPRFSEENVRQMFTSSAAALLDDFHIDGLRVDLTDAIHQDNTLNANGASIGSANLYGIKFLRELARTVKLLNPSAFLIAEDHTGWSAMTQSPDQGGVGFDAVWYADFYHHLIGDGNYGDNFAKLLKNAGYGAGGPLNMDYFAGALLATQYNKIAYHENHDEAGNETNTERTIATAVNRAPLIAATRQYAEARCRFCFGLAALSAGTPMFLMGEEVGAAKYFRYNDFFMNKEDLIGERTADGRFLFRFYQDLIRLVTEKPAARSRALDVIYRHNDNRVIAFTRSSLNQQLLVLASLNDAPFDHGYFIGTDSVRLPAGGWQEIFNSDAAIYGGANVGNGSATLLASSGRMNAVIPARGFVVFEKVS